MSEIKKRKSNVEEKKVRSTYSVRPSVRITAQSLVKEDESVKSYNDLIEKLLLDYISKRVLVAKRLKK